MPSPSVTHDSGNTQINVSTTFFPAAPLPGVGQQICDLIIHAADGVYFYCHRGVLTAKSGNSFGTYLQSTPPGSNSAISTTSSPARSPSNPPVAAPHTPPKSSGTTPTIFVSEHAKVLNVVLHLVYGMTLEKYRPDVDTLQQALECLPKYGLPIPGNSSEVWVQLLEHASANPIQVYSIAARNGIHSVCVLASQFTLGVPLQSVSEGQALTMGAIYLRSLYVLHLDRFTALKKILKETPAEHPATDNCSVTANQRGIKYAWKARAADILLDDMPQNTSPDRLSTNFGKLVELSSCSTCKENIRARVAAMVHDWVM
ncbi:hypothetical protein FRB99_002877, partial [Tulasnella sp. 403]